MAALFGATIFLGALLLFLVQPMVARMLLPSLGGSPAVWNTCMVFFQGALLGGYAYAHWMSRALGTRRLPIVHAVVLAAPIVLLVRWGGVTAGPPADASPVGWLLFTLAATIGLPFLALSTGAPLLQRWFSATDHRAAKDPYFLYAASNAGSLVALLAYPLVVERTLSLESQRFAWTIGYCALAGLTAACGWVTIAHGRRATTTDTTPAGPGLSPGMDAAPSWRTRALWVVLAAVPSSLMLGVTQHLSTDVAAMPLLWIVPLAIYLLTFILAFAGRTLVPVGSVSKILPVLMVGLAVAFILQAKRPIGLLFLLHLLAFFLCAMLCHGRLAASRPAAARLTEFYLWIAVGGVIGGMFNALAAPVVFTGVYEYPIALVAACLLRLPRTADPAPSDLSASEARMRRVRIVLYDLIVPLAILGIAGVAIRVAWGLDRALLPQADRGDLAQPLKLVLGVGVPAVIAYLGVGRPIRFALGVAALFIVAASQGIASGTSLHRERTFFGLYEVVRQRYPEIVRVPTFPFGRVHRLTVQRESNVFYHGTTLHGQQFTDPERRNTPLTYYHPDGPIGHVFATFGGSSLFDRVGLVGLGTGSLAAYGRPGQRMTFFEIDPAVVRIASNPAYFTYLSENQSRNRAAVDFVIGDGRLSLRDRAEPGEFGLIVLDAFTSDAIPIHLITREALKVYVSRLKPGGIIAFHVSNQYLSLPPVVARLAQDQGLAALGGGLNDNVDRDEAVRTGRVECVWMLVARDRADFGPLLNDKRWLELEAGPDAPLWTDDYSNILSVFSFN
ncbi:MAG: spermidine synthase [Phycisphaerales bacterium]